MNLEAIKGKKKRLLQVIYDPDLDNVEAICKKAGISKDTYYRYLKDENFTEAVKLLGIRVFAHRLPMTVRSVLRQSEKGDMKAAKLVLEALQLSGKGNTQTMNVAMHDQPQPTTLDIDTPEQLEQAIAQCTAEMGTLQEIMDNLVAMRQQSSLPGRAGTNRLKGDGIHPGTDATTDEEA